MFERYGVSVVGVPSATWKVKSVRKLTPDENKGKHHVYINVLDENGNRIIDSNLKIGWGWEGQRQDENAPPYLLDKNEQYAANVPIWRGQIISVWVEGEPSDIVKGMHTSHPAEIGSDGKAGSDYGHHSFEVIFEYSNSVILPEPPIEPPTTKTLEQRVTRIEQVLVKHGII